MKRRSVGIIMGIIACMLVASVVLAEVQYKVVVNGKPLQSDVPPMNVSGRLLVPLRAVSEALGADVSYDAASYTAVINSKPAAAALSEAQKQELLALNQLREDMTAIGFIAMWTLALTEDLEKDPGETIASKSWTLLSEMGAESFEAPAMTHEYPELYQIVTKSGTELTPRQLAMLPAEISKLLVEAQALYEANDTEKFASLVNDIQWTCFGLGLAAENYNQAIKERVQQIVGSSQAQGQPTP